MYIESLSLRDFKCFQTAKLLLQHPDRRSSLELPNVNLIVGDNGGGKSSILRALAISSLSPVIDGSGYVPYHLVRRPSAKQGSLETVHVLSDGELQKLREPRISVGVRIVAPGETRDRFVQVNRSEPLFELLLNERTPDFFLAGYGATRRVETGDFIESSHRKSRSLRYQRVSGLFEEHIALRPLASWLPYLNRNRLMEVRRIFSRLLPTQVQLDNRRRPRAEEFFVRWNGRQIPFNSLSDGYKSFIGWTGDLISRLVDVCPPKASLTSLPGVVLVDEIDLHLHPQWQRTIVPTLAKTFPRLQFVFTTHSPLVVSGVSQRNTFISDINEKGISKIRQLEERVSGGSADQVLTSSYFGLETTRPESFTKKAADLLKRAKSPNATTARAAALQYLSTLTASTEAQAENQTPSISGRITKTLAKERLSPAKRALTHKTARSSKKSTTKRKTSSNGPASRRK